MLLHRVRPLSTLLRCSSLLLGLTALAHAQQFTHQAGLLPGPAVWTEGVQAVDVDGDGDLDLCFSNGDGFSGPGTQRQAGLLINQFIPSGILSFTDESVARLGLAVANGKGITAGDVNGDGWVDLLYLNAFNTDTPFLFINRGAVQPGFFDLESAARGFTENLSSAGAQFGDLDDDGDLDVIINDSGASFLGGSGGRPRLYFNDGTGHFTENASALNAPLKAAHMDVQLVDLDGDWHVDFFGANRATNSAGYHYVMLNDGAGNFSDVSNLLPNTSGSVYEAEVSDLDGDNDVDFYFVSVSGFQEGPIRNDLVETGSLGFSTGTPESGFVDDNEVALMDYDNDGDLDVFIGSLGSRERLYRNDGALQFTEQSTQIQAVNDSTLDITVADLDNDGDYDLVTAQGESNPGQYANKVYLNSGPADTTAPVLVDADIPASTITWPVVLKAKFRDSVMDDGVDYVESALFAAPYLGVQGLSVYDGTLFTPSAISLSAGESLVLTNSSGTQLTFTATGPAPFAIDLNNGQSAERAFLQPGSYTILAGGSPLTVTVTGSPSEIAGLPMGVGQHRFAIPQQAPSPNNLLVAELRLRDGAGNETWGSFVNIPYPMGGTEVYCDPANSNTSGLRAKISTTGSIVVADQNFGLMAIDMPNGEFGYFLGGTDRGFIANPGGSFGNLCLGGALARFNDLSEIGNTGATGSFSLSVDLNALPFNPVATVMVGDTYTFQCWYRDSLIQSSNFSNAISVTFQ